MAATDKGALRSAQISEKYLAGGRAPVIGAEGFACVTDKGDVEIVGSVRCAFAGCDCCLHPSLMALT